MQRFPSAKSLGKTIVLLQDASAKKIGTDFCTVGTNPTQKIEYWEEYAPQGKTLPHSLGSDVKPIPWGKSEKKEVKPGYFKEKLVLTEDMLLEIEEMGNEYQVMTIERWAGKGLDKINQRATNLINWAIWQAVLTGSVVVNEGDVKFKASYGIPDENLALTVAVSWDTPTSSKPMKDITSVMQSFIGTGYKLGKIKMNSITADKFVNSSNTQTVWNGTAMKEKFTLGNIETTAPSLTPGVSWEVNDDGYTNDAGTFSGYIPDNKVLFLGNASDIMNYVSVPHLENGRPAPSINGIFVMPDYKHLTDPNPFAEISGGTYGIPAIYRPTIIFVMDVTKTS